LEGYGLACASCPARSDVRGGVARRRFRRHSASVLGSSGGASRRFGARRVGLRFAHAGTRRVAYPEHEPAAAGSQRPASGRVKLSELPANLGARRDRELHDRPRPRSLRGSVSLTSRGSEGYCLASPRNDRSPPLSALPIRARSRRSWRACLIWDCS
jgi:hypothetical protein